MVKTVQTLDEEIVKIEPASVMQSPPGKANEIELDRGWNFAMDKERGWMFMMTTPLATQAMMLDGSSTATH
jgi:hypothetical protein